MYVSSFIFFQINVLVMKFGIVSIFWARMSIQWTVVSRRWDCIAVRPASCCHRCRPRTSQMRQDGPVEIRARPRAMLGHPQTQHTTVQQLRFSLRLIRVVFKLKLFWRSSWIKGPRWILGPSRVIFFLFLGQNGLFCCRTKSSQEQISFRQIVKRRVFHPYFSWTWQNKDHAF